MKSQATTLEAMVPVHGIRRGRPLPGCLGTFNRVYFFFLGRVSNIHRCHGTWKSQAIILMPGCLWLDVFLFYEGSAKYLDATAPVSGYFLVQEENAKYLDAEVPMFGCFIHIGMVRKIPRNQSTDYRVHSSFKKSQSITWKQWCLCLSVRII